MNINFFIKFCLGAIVTFFIISLFKGNFEWDNLVPILVGGLFGTVVTSYKSRS
ncbi:hypothetical protein SAMN05444673_2184 [Bacillus sp. OV166]|nr:hypothetical protein SAMN05444673_2184 [Bacillus sp. OV166]